MINTIDGILEAAKGGKTGVIAVAAAHDDPGMGPVTAAPRGAVATRGAAGHPAESREMGGKAGEAPAA